MNNQTHTPLYLAPLHGVELCTPSHQHRQHEELPFHIKISTSYDSKTQLGSLPIWSMLDKGERYSSLVELYKEGDKHQLSIMCEGQGTFTFDQYEMLVDWQSSGTGFEHYLQSLGLASWLELQGIPCIHANAVTLDDNAALIIAPSRTGKSTLTTVLTQHQFKLMTDDMAAIHSTTSGMFTIYPSWPKIRLWPDIADSLIGTELDSVDRSNKVVSDNNGIVANNDLLSAEKKHVHQKFAKFEIEFKEENNIWRTTPAPLKAIYYLERLDETADIDCIIERLNSSRALVILMQNSMLADAYISMGIEIERLASLAKILGSVPLFKISYKSGLNNLENVADRLKKHMIQDNTF